MNSNDPSIGKMGPIKYAKVVANIPKELLKEFDMICELKYYSRVEAIKQAMREFIINTMPEDYVSPNMVPIYKNLTKEAMIGLTEGAVEVSNDPKYKQLQTKFDNTQSNHPQLQEKRK